MNVLVLGGNGFIGSHIVDALCATHHTVRIFDRSADPWRPKLDGVRYYTGDFTHRATGRGWGSRWARWWWAPGSPSPCSRRAGRDAATAATSAATVAAPATHMLRVESSPAGALVTEGGQLLGKTPLSLPLPSGATATRQFVVSLEGYAPYVIEQPPAQEDVRVVVPLAPAPVTQVAKATAAASSEPTAQAKGRRPSSGARSRRRRPSSPSRRPATTTSTWPAELRLSVPQHPQSQHAVPALVSPVRPAPLGSRASRRAPPRSGANGWWPS